MRDHQRLHLHTESIDAEDRFLRSYLPGATDRLAEAPACEAFVPVRMGEAEVADDDGGLVIVDVYGDPEAVIDRERDRWDEFVADPAGPLTRWERSDTDVVARLAEATGLSEAAVERQERLRALAARMAAASYRATDEPPAPAEEYPDRDADMGVGWHRTLHILANQHGYSPGEELDAYEAAVESCLGILARTEGVDRATDRADELIATVESVRAELGEE